MDSTILYIYIYQLWEMWAYCIEFYDFFETSFLTDIQATI